MKQFPAPWRKPAPGPLLRAAHQRRSKAFVRQVDQDNEVFYTLLARDDRSVNKVRQEAKLFEASNLLLDLDAEDSKAARLFEPEDEDRLGAAWKVAPGTKDALGRLRDLKQDVSVIRSKVDSILSTPTNPWRITGHDLLAVALRGAATDEQMTSTPPEAPQESLSALTEKLRVENGIPDHVASEDDSLLKWLALRRRTMLAKLEKQPERLKHDTHFISALYGLTSIDAISRLVFQWLDAGVITNKFASQERKAKINIPLDIRRACIVALAGPGSTTESQTRALKMVSNMVSRLSKDDVSLGGPLLGLGLRSSVYLKAVEGTRYYLKGVCDYEIRPEHPKMSRDVFYALQCYTKHLTTSPQDQDVDDLTYRQTVFQLLTGLDKEGYPTRESFRTLLVGSLVLKRVKKHEVPLLAYREYLNLLGQLGAFRMLWKEWRLTAPLLLELAAADVCIPHLERAVDEIPDMYLSALKLALQHAPPSPSESDAADLELVECITLDYNAIESQEAGPRLNREEDGLASPLTEGELEVADVRAALDLPLDQWLEQCRRLSSMA